MLFFNKSARRRFQLHKLLLPLLCGFYSLQAHAVLNITLEQLGPDVNLTASGSVNLGALGAPGSFTCNSGINTFSGLVVAGDPGSVPCEVYTITGFSPSPRPGFGGTVDSVNIPSSGTGIAGLSGSASSPALTVPTGYVSGASLSASSVFSGTDLATLEASPGTYTLSWGSGANADSIVIEIRVGSVSATAVPALPLYALIALSGLVGLLGTRHLRGRMA